MSENASVHEVQPSDSTRFIQLIDKQVALMSDVTETPLSLLQRSAQRAAEGTLQEEKDDFNLKIRNFMDTIELGLEDALRISRRLHNVYSSYETLPELSEEPTYSVVWKPLTTRSTADRATDAQAMITSQFPVETVWADAWDKSPDEIAAMVALRKNSLYGEEVLRTADDSEDES